MTIQNRQAFQNLQISRQSSTPQSLVGACIERVLINFTPSIFTVSERKAMSAQQSQHIHETMHALRQPLNALRLTLANLTHRISADGDRLDVAYAQAKLDAMDAHIQRMADLIESLQMTKKDTDA